MPFTTDPAMNRLVLVIDDNPSVCEDFRKILQTNIRAVNLAEARAALFEETPQDDLQEGFEVDCADQGQTGLAMVERGVQRGCPYAVAFVDMLMPPGWDGIETIDYLWRADPALEIVMCTAFTDLLWDRLTQQFGHTDKLLILRKPFDNIEVWQLASALTQKWHLAQHGKRQLASFQEMVEQHREELQMGSQRLQAAITQHRQGEEALAQRTRDWTRSNITRPPGSGRAEERWQPALHQPYVTILGDGSLTVLRWSNVPFDYDAWQFGNCFRTRREAERAREALRLVLLSLHTEYGR